MELQLVKSESCNKNESFVSFRYEYEVAMTELRFNDHYILWYQNITNLLVTGIIPFLSLIYLNLNIYLKFKRYLQRQPLTAKASVESNFAVNNVRERVRKRDKDMIHQTMILFAIVILFGLSHALRIILNISEFANLDSNNKARDRGCLWLQYWTIIAAPVSHLLLQLNSSTTVSYTHLTLPTKA